MKKIVNQLNNKIVIAHVSSVHARDDVRIRVKMIRTLSAYFSCKFYVADGKGCKVESDGTEVIDVGAFRSRLARVVMSSLKMYREISRDKGVDLYHLHDPELLLLALMLNLAGKTVVFDLHEDVKKQLYSKDYIPKGFRSILAFMLDKIERFALARVSTVIAATASIARSVSYVAKKTHVINNYPLSAEFSWRDDLKQTVATNRVVENCYVIYIGGISKIRGIQEMCEAVAKTRSQCELHLYGEFNDEFGRKYIENNLNPKIRYFGLVDRESMAKHLSNAIAGLVLFHPVPNHIEAQPNKLFEYMSAGLPVIASDFPLWREVVDKNECGLCVEVFSTDKIAEAIDTIICDESLRKRIKLNGMKSVKDRYNWESEGEKLIQIYIQLNKSNLLC